MAIDPTVWNGLVDDDGSNLTGSIWNKAAIKSVVLDPPLSILRYASSVSVNIPGGTNHNNYVVPGGPAAVVWFLNPSSPLGITGFAAEANLTQHLLINTTGFTIVFYNQNAQSLAANRILGPGYADYSLGVWGSIWMLYTASGWILQKAT
jgi:hypothetical protein